MPLHTLPNELILFVAESLPFSALLPLRLTSKHLHTVLKRINRRRIVIQDCQNLQELNDEVARLGDKFVNVIGLKISSNSILPAGSISPKQRSVYDLLAGAQNLNYLTLSLPPYQDVNISFIPPFSPSSDPCLPSITHLCIINYRLTPSFLSALPNLIEVTVALVLQPHEHKATQLQYKARDVVSCVKAIQQPSKLRRFTMTVTSVTPEFVGDIVRVLDRLESLSLVWYPEMDVAHGGVEVSDCSSNLDDYITALSPVRSTLQSLHLPLCYGSTGPLDITDDELGSGVVCPPIRRHSAWAPSVKIPVKVGVNETTRACERFAIGTRRSGPFKKLQRIGWLIPQGAGDDHEDGVPHLLVDCVRQMTPDAATEEPEDRAEPPKRPIEDAESGESGEDTSEADSSAGEDRRKHPILQPRFRPFTPSTPPPIFPGSFASIVTDRLNAFGAPSPAPAPQDTALDSSTKINSIIAPVPRFLPISTMFLPSRSNSASPAPLPRAIPDRWDLSMAWRDGYAWPPSEMEDVFPLGFA